MGTFCLVLHTHLPYLRKNGVWPVGEDLFHQAAVESYLPLLGALDALAERGLRDQMTVGLTPMVVHQMRDEHMRHELDLYLGRWELRAWRQVARYDGVFEREFKDLAAFFARFGREQSERLDEVGTIADGFRRLADANVIQLIGGPATHPYLPLVTEPSLADAQMRLGVASHAASFGAAPGGAWLPECAYTPGVEDLLERHAISYTIVDGPTLLRSSGPGATFTPWTIRDSSVTAFARNLDVTYRVWSPTGGYPAGKWYRDFFHYDLEGGFKNWRVTSVRKPLDRKRPYEPEAARAAVERDAADFVALVTKTLEAYERETGREGLVLAAYDTELFGHWWFEGPAFLQRVFELFAESPVRAMSLARARERLDAEPVELVAGTWGFRKDMRSWVSEETQHLWETLSSAEAETVRLVEKYADAAPAAIAQIVRECMLMQSSDWPFMVLRGRNPDYARERFYKHHERWNHIADLLRRAAPAETVRGKVAGMFEADNIFPALTPADVR
ncbi:MAG: 1,4-alpha-glucan branching protein domain-containing protein [Actinomycetota bacterium]